MALAPIFRSMMKRTQFLQVGLLLWLAIGLATAAPCRIEPESPAANLQACTAILPAADALRALAAANPAAYEGTWYRFDLDAAPGKRLLDLGIPDAYRLDVYQAGNGTPRRLFSLDENSRFADRPVRHRRLIVPLEFHGGPLSIYVHYRTHGKTPLFPRLLTEEQLIASDTLANLANGMQFGVMLVIVAVLAFGLGPQQNRSYRIYAGLVLSSLLFVAQVEGYGSQFLWPDAPVWNMQVPAVLATLVLSWHIAFAVNFLQMKTRMPVLYRIHIGIFVVGVLSLPLYIFWLNVEWMFGLSMLYAPLGCYCAWQGVRQNIPAARFYLLGILWLAAFVALLFPISVMGFNPLPRLSALQYPKIGYLGESLLFAAAVVSQIRQLNERQAELRVRRLAETEQLLQAEQHKLAALEKARQQQLQLASASHDISQPLASIRFAIAALGQQHEHKPIADHIDNTINYAQTLLKDLMTQARQEHHEPERIDLNALFAQLEKEFAGAANAKGLRLSVRGSRVPLAGSSLLLYRMLSNLLANAVRYTNKGRILLGVRRRGDAVEIQVWDTGPGIPEATRRAMLQPFRQGHDTGVGYGLGLFIVKNLCEQCGYKLAIHSKVGSGSGFCVAIPQAV